MRPYGAGVPVFSLVKKLVGLYRRFAIERHFFDEITVEVVPPGSRKVIWTGRLAYGTGKSQVVPVGATLIIIHLPATHTPSNDSLIFCNGTAWTGVSTDPALVAEVLKPEIHGFVNHQWHVSGHTGRAIVVAKLF